MRYRIHVVASLALLSLAFAGMAGAAGSQPVSPPASAPSVTQTPQEAAEASYNLGLKHRDKAWKSEEKAEAAGSDAERQKFLDKARKQYGKAIPLLRNATDKVPSFHQAFSALGYALRKSGNYDESLEAYDRALQLAPRYGEAIEYRAEAYLGLNRMDDAKKAYIQLFNLDRALADQLMEAMGKWLENRRAEPAGLSAEALDEFGAWCKERHELASQTARLSEAAERTWSD